MSEDDLFVKEMGLVKPIQSKVRAQAETQQKTKHKVLRHLENLEHQITTSTNPIKFTSSRSEKWLIRGDGISSKDIKKLAQIHMAHELDLHGYTLNQAIVALAEFIEVSLSQKLRYINIIHGKGNNSDGGSVLKTATYDWLEHGSFSSHILAATQGLQSKGGACHVLLRKQNR